MRWSTARRRVLVVQRTGWGKSAVYFIATRLLREGAGPALLISPLLALMRNQIEMAQRACVHAATINSANPDDWHEVESHVRRGEVDLLLISPGGSRGPCTGSRPIPRGFLGIEERGTVEVAGLADVGVIDIDNLAVDPLAVARDLPGGAARLFRGASGYRAVLPSGSVTTGANAAGGSMALRDTRAPG